MASDANKAQMLRVSPVVLPISIDPGAERTYTINITNLLTTPLPVQLSIEGFEATDEEGGIKTDTNVSSPLSSWITLASPDILLPANASQDIPVVVRIPSTIPVGGYYATIMMTPRIPQTKDSTPVVIPKIGIVVLAGIGVPAETTDAHITIPGFAFTSTVFNGNPISGAIRVKNTALIHQTVKPILEFTPFVGGSAFGIELPDKVILPGKIRRWDISARLPEPLKGLYLVKARVSVGKGIYVTRDLWLVVFPWQEAAIGIGAVVSAILAVRYRKRIRNAVAILSGK